MTCVFIDLFHSPSLLKERGLSDSEKGSICLSQEAISIIMGERLLNNPYPIVNNWFIGRWEKTVLSHQFDLRSAQFLDFGVVNFTCTLVMRLMTVVRKM